MSPDVPFYSILGELFVGQKRYELSNHLGNVLAVVNDRKDEDVTGTTVNFSTPTIISANDYYPFGLQMDQRSYTLGSVKGHRYGFNGKEKDGEFGSNTTYDFGARIYNPSIGRWFSRDPLEKKFASLSTYNFALNNPLRFNDPDGKSANDIIVRVRDDNGGVYLELDYRNDGNLYTVDGKLYDGNSSVALKIQTAINIAKNNDERLDDMFGELEDSEHEHEFTNVDPKMIRTDSYNRKTVSGNNIITQFRPEVNRGRAKRNGRELPTDSDVATHEAKHAYDKDKNRIRSSARKNGEVPDSELDAINTTNTNRAAESRALRKDFGGKPISEDKLEKPSEYNPLHSGGDK